MPQPFGSASKTFILKSESHKLHEEFEVDAYKVTLTAGGTVPMVTSNVINGKVNGQAIAAVTFTTDHATTMGLIAAQIALNPNVKSASVTATNVITAVAKYPEQANLALHEFVTTAGSTQCTWTYGVDNNNIVKGQPVKLTTSGTVEPYAAGDIPGKLLGYAVQDAHGGDLVTVMLKAFAIIYAEAYAASHLPGVIRMAAFNLTTKMMEVDDGGTLDHTTVIGNALDSGNDGDVVRVAVF
jgi:hypothetical protein